MSRSVIRVLHLEDNTRDAELIAGSLAREGLVSDIIHADGREAFEAALGGESVDLVLCDYSLPGFDGLAALKIALEYSPSTPVIVISGSLDDEQAVECLKTGATDYVFKQNLRRLGPAVRRALAEAEERRRRQAAETALDESEQRFRELAESSSDVFWFFGVNPEKVLYISPAAERVWGIPLEKISKTPRAVFEGIHVEDRARVQDGLEQCLEGTRDGSHEEYRIVRSDGSTRWLMTSTTVIRDETGRVVRLSGVTKDITEVKLLQDQFLRAQRLESVGTLASGIAHDLNNALTPGLMAVQMLRRKYGGDEDRTIEMLESSLQRAGRLVKQVLTFGRGIQGQPVILQVRHIIQDFQKVAEQTFPKSILLRTDVPRDLRAISADPTQLEQILMNLGVNARDAMPDGGTLTIRARNVGLDETYGRMNMDAKVGPYVQIEVTDTGEGMPPGVLERIFEPFFTTKEIGKGTGLGLSTVHTIVKNHGGFVRVSSEVGRGTTFKIYIPAAEGDEVAAPRDGGPAPMGRGELILVVDDDMVIRDMVRSLLESSGYRVAAVENGAEGVARYAQGGIAVALVDWEMPVMNGRQTVEAIQKIDPSARVIVSSGMSHVAEVSRLEVPVPFLEKPYTAEDLLARLSELTGAPEWMSHDP